MVEEEKEEEAYWLLRDNDIRQVIEMFIDNVKIT